MVHNIKQFLVVANMKMNVIQENYLNEYRNLDLTTEKYKAILLPPMPFILTLHNIMDNNIQNIGVQNIHAESEGSFTGLLALIW